MLKVKQFVSIIGLGETQTSTNKLAFPTLSAVYTESTRNRLCINLCLILGTGKAIANIEH